MARNLYFSDGFRGEQNLYEDLIVESLKIYGHDLYYIPRDLVNIDDIFKEDPIGSFNSSHKIEMYVENSEGFDGEGDLFSKFGVEIRDSVTLIVSKRRWIQTVKRYDAEVKSLRPLEGDLIFAPFANKIFQIMHVEHEQPFYQLNNLPIFKLRCELFEYSDEDLDTGIAAIDAIEQEYAYTYMLTLNDSAQTGIFELGEVVNQTLPSGVVMSGEVSRWSDSDNKLGLIHVGASNGKFGQFSSGISITGANSSATGTVTLVSEDGLIKASSTEKDQNVTFDGSSLTFLDFSESNPFGDPQ